MKKEIKIVPGLKELDASILDELFSPSNVPKSWIVLFSEILAITRAYARSSVEHILGVVEQDALNETLATGDFNRLCTDRARLSALNVRLGLVTGILNGRFEGAYAQRKRAYAQAVLSIEHPKSEDKKKLRKYTTIEISALAEVNTYKERTMESVAQSLKVASELLMHRTKEVLGTLETAIQILQIEMRRMGDADYE